MIRNLTLTFLFSLGSLVILIGPNLQATVTEGNLKIAKETPPEFHLMDNPSQDIINKIGKGDGLRIEVGKTIIIAGKSGDAALLKIPAKELRNTDGTLTKQGYELFCNKDYEGAIHASDAKFYFPSLYMYAHSLSRDDVYIDENSVEHTIKTNLSSKSTYLYL